MFTESENLLERYSLAGRAGFKNVEVAFPYDHSIESLVTAKKNANVNQILINVFPGTMPVLFDYQVSQVSRVFVHVST